MARVVETLDSGPIDRAATYLCTKASFLDCPVPRRDPEPESPHTLVAVVPLVVSRLGRRANRRGSEPSLEYTRTSVRCCCGEMSELRKLRCGWSTGPETQAQLRDRLERGGVRYGARRRGHEFSDVFACGRCSSAARSKSSSPARPSSIAAPANHARRALVALQNTYTTFDAAKRGELNRRLCLAPGSYPILERLGPARGDAVRLRWPQFDPEALMLCGRRADRGVGGPRPDASTAR
jgi:hypothetical protein